MTDPVVVLTGCKACNSPFRDQINRRMAEGVPDMAVSAWLKSNDAYISRLALGRHRNRHLMSPVDQARMKAAKELKAQQGMVKGPTSTKDLAVLVRDAVAAKIAGGEIAPNVSEGLRAQEILDRRAEKTADRDLMLQIAQAIGGAVPIRVVEGEYQEIPETTGPSI